MKNFTLKSSKQFISTDTLFNLKKRIHVLVIVLVGFLGVSQSAYAFDIPASTTYYFDNSQTQWTSTNVYFYVGHASYLRSYQMTQVGSTDIYSITMAAWSGATAVFFANTAGGISGGSSSFNVGSIPSGAAPRTVNYTSLPTANYYFIPWGTQATNNPNTSIGGEWKANLNVPANVLSGTDVMFYINQSYAGTLGVTNNSSSTCIATTSLTSLNSTDKYLSMAAANVPGTLSVSNSCGSWSGDGGFASQTSANAAGAYYITGATTSKTSASVSASPSSASISFGTTSINLTGTTAAATSAYGRNMYIQYYVNGAATPTLTSSKVSSTTTVTSYDTSSLSVGTYTIIPVMTDRLVFLKGASFTVTVTSSCPTITVTPSATPSATGTVGTAYTSVTFSATGGAGSYTYALNSGTLPAGLTLNSSTGVLSGTPTTAASYTFAVKATDANSCVGSVGSYTVVISACTVGTWLGGTSTNWNTAANWSCATIPTSTTNVTIPSGTTYSPNISSAAAVANSVTISASAALTMSGGNTLTISSGGSFTNNNAFNRGDGTVIFAGSGTITGTVVFNNITLSGVVTNGSAVTVNGTLQINSGGSLSTVPTYDCNSLLKYNSGSNPQTRGNEWTSAAVPGNVQISNNTTMDADNVGGTGSQSATICGTFTIDSGSSFYMDYGGGSGSLTIGKNIVINGNLSLGGATLGDLSLGGNWTHTTGTITYNNRTVFFNGSTGDQTITKSGGETFDFININKTTSGNVVLANAVTINQTLTLTKGLLVLGNNNVTFGSSGTSSSASTSSYIAVTGSGKVIKAHTGSFDYPVGPNTTNYAPVTINNTGASQTYTIGVANTTYTPLIDAVNWQWSIVASGSSSSNLSFKWFTADSGANLNAAPSSGIAQNYNGSSWTSFTSSTTASTPNTTTVNGVTNFTNTIWTVTKSCSGSTAAVLSGTATICNGNSTNLSVAITGGTSPFTVIYNDGTTNFTVSSYTSGTAISVSPTSTKTYTLVSVTGDNGCAGTGNSGTPTVTVTSGALDGANLQYYGVVSGSRLVCYGSSFDAFGRVYEPGVTSITGPGLGIVVEFGYSTSNNNPNSAGWTWASAAFSEDKSVDKDEYKYVFTPPSAGTFYFTFRYSLNGCAWQYGGYQNNYNINPSGGFWNGTTFINGQADVSSTVLNANAGSDQSKCNSGSFTMAGNAVSSPAQGTWTVVSGTASIASANSATTSITGVPLGTSATLKWRITNGPCTATEDLVIITNSSTNNWIGTTSTDWNTATNWCGGVPTSSSTVVIPSGTAYSPSIYQTANAVANSVTIAPGASLSMSNAYSLSITAGGFITNNSTFNAGDGTVNFLGNGTITGTIAFNNINLSGSVSFSNAVTVNTRLRIVTGGAVTSNAPTYGSGSLLQYYTGASYNRSFEWTTATSGAGYPVNVQVSTNSTNTTLNMLTTIAQCSGNLTIDSGNTMNTTSNTLTVIGNVLIDGTMSLAGDVKTRGNWTVGTSGTQTNNGKAVFFTGTSGNQTITRTSGTDVFFDYLIIDKTSGDVVISNSPATNVTLNANTGQVLQLNNTGRLDLNGRSLILNNSGGSIYVNGDRSIISSPVSPNGTIEVNQYKFVGNNSGIGTLSLGATVTVNLNTNGNLDFGFSGGNTITTINGILSINSNTNCFVNTNPPIYSNTSTLIYNSGGTRYRNLEWSATSGAGYPNNVIVQNQTTLEVANGSDTYRKIAGNLTILGAATSGTVGCTNCSKFRITDLYTASPATVSGTIGVGVEIGGDIYNNGRIELKGDTNARLKCTNFFNGDTTTEGRKSTTALSGDLNATPPYYGNYGGDLEVTDDFQDDASFVSNQRAVFFTGSGVQDVRGSAPGTLNIDYVVVAKSGSTNPVLLNKELLIGAPQGGSAVVFYTATDIIDLNGFKLTVGTSGIYNTVIGDGKFKGGSNNSELSLLGIGEIGTINFDNTTPGTTNNLKYLTLNRTISAPTHPTAGFTLGSDLDVSTTATLTAGTINLASANMTIGASASIAITSPDATKMVIASGTGELRKTYSSAGSFTFPIGDNVGTAEYSPATLAFSGSPSGYAGVRVQNAKHPNINVGIADYISRYWPVTSTIASPTCDASFTYLASDENGTVANYFGGRYLSPDWYCLDDVDETNRVISKTNLNAFGDFTVYNPPAITSALTTSAATICANTSTNLQVAIGGGDTPYTVGPFTVVYYNSDLASSVTVNNYISGANIPVSPTANTTYTLQSVTSSKACSSTASDTKTISIGGTSTYNLGWTPSAPTSTSTAVITSSYNQSANINACSLRVSNNSVVTIPSTYKVTLSGALTVDTGSSFTLENDSNLVQTTGTTNPNSGSIQVKRNSSSLYLLDYTLWSSPVENQNLFAFSPNTSIYPKIRFYDYNESTDFYDPIDPGINNFTVGRGYLIRVPTTFSATVQAVYNGVFTGKPNSGTITYPMSMAGAGFNAVGNPYPSQINVHNFLDANTNTSGILYFWRKKNDQYATSYATLTRDDYAANAAAGGDTGSTYFNGTASSNWVLNVGQGFFVQATSATNLVFTNTMRRGENNGNQFFRTSNKTTSTPSKYKLNLTSTNGFFSQMALSYASDYTLGVDKGVDAFNINSNYLCSSIEGMPYAIQGRPEFTVTDVVPLVYKIPVSDEYSIAIDLLVGVFVDQDVFLKDKLTNTIHNLKTGPYTFGSELGSFADRFEVLYESPLAVNQNNFNDNSVVVYKQNQDIVINTGKTQMSNVKIYDIRGRLLVSKSNINASQVKLFAGTTQQVLIVKITSDTNAIVTKKVVN